MEDDNLFMEALLGELGSDALEELAETVLPPLIASLIENGRLDAARCEDREYLQQVIEDNLEELEDFVSVSVTFEDTMLRAVRSEMEAGRVEPALVLAGTCMEHMLNRFYIDVLGHKHSLGNADMDAALKAAGMADKTSWFFRLATGYEFDGELRGMIRQINGVRNQMVHYKPIPEHVDDQVLYHKLREKVDGATPVLLACIEKLGHYLREVEMRLFPSRAQADEIFSAFRGDAGTPE